MDINEHRKATVRHLIRACRTVEPIHIVEEAEEQDRHDQVATCTATGLFFVDKMSQMVVTWSNVGFLWMGLWLDSPFYLHDNDNPISKAHKKKNPDFHGNTLFPRWLAEVLNQECELDIEEKDIYDEPHVRIVPRHESDMLYDNVSEKAKALFDGIGELATFIQKQNRQFRIPYSPMEHRVATFRIDLGTFIRDLKSHFGK